MKITFYTTEYIVYDKTRKKDFARFDTNEEAEKYMKEVLEQKYPDSIFVIREETKEYKPKETQNE